MQAKLEPIFIKVELEPMDPNPSLHLHHLKLIPHIVNHNNFHRLMLDHHLRVLVEIVELPFQELLVLMEELRL